MKLFAVYVGGRTATSRVELHDMCFAAGERIEDCYEDLYAQWWGVPESLHIDSWAELACVDGYDVSLKPEPYGGEEKLWFVNLGGYDPHEFTELHRNVFVVAPRTGKAKARAIRMVDELWPSRHSDYDYEIETMLCLKDILKSKGLHIHLAPAAEVKPFTFNNGYHPIRKKEGG